MSPEYHPDHRERIPCPVRECRCASGVVEWHAGEQVWTHVVPADLDDDDPSRDDSQL